MSYREMLSEFSSAYPTTLDFIRHMKDHKRILMNTATVYKLDSVKMYKYNHRMSRFLRHINYPTQLEWLVLWLNDITNATFKDPITLLVPSIKTVDKLHEHYVEWVHATGERTSK